MNDPAALDRFARYYDLEYRHYDADVDFYLSRISDLGCEVPRVLELGCGSGRLLKRLVQFGCDVTGVDASPAMLRLAEDRLGKIKAALYTLMLGRMESLALPANYRADMVIVALNTFQYLTSAEAQAAMLTAVRPHLAPGGELVIALPGPANWPDFVGGPAHLILQGTFPDPSIGGVVQKWFTSDFDPASQLEEVTFLYDEIEGDGNVRRTVAPLTLRHSFRYEVEHLLTASGYHLEAVYGDYDHSPFDASSEQMIFVAHI